jgi:hypothetical protein
VIVETSVSITLWVFRHFRDCDRAITRRLRAVVTLDSEFAEATAS